MKYIILVILALWITHPVISASADFTLIEATKSGRAFDVSDLLRSGVSPDITDTKNKTALMYVAERYGSQGHNSGNKDAFIVHQLLTAQSGVSQEVLKKSLKTGNATLIKAVVTAFHQKSGTIFPKEEYLNQTIHSKNLKILIVGLQTGILTPSDITNETIKSFLVHADLVSISTLQKLKKRIKQTSAVSGNYQTNEADSSNTDSNPCAVCTRSLNNAATMELECKHEFHTTCMQQWVARSSTCPLCRTPTQLVRYGSTHFIHQ